jgi:15-hydroxyprostaglandin dehydrogenase (NAD)
LEVLRKKYKNCRYEYYACDVKDVSEFTACYERVLAHKSYVDILINNAGVIDDKNIDLTIDVNFKAVVHGTMIAVERMGKHKNNKGGVVVNVASKLGLENHSSLPVYCASKHAVVSFVRSMKEHNKTLGVRIVSLCPGQTNTNMIKPDNLRNSALEFVSQDEIDQLQHPYIQSPDSVASAIIEIIKRGNEGDVWLAQHDQPPFYVSEVTDFEKLRIPV